MAMAAARLFLCLVSSLALITFSSCSLSLASDQRDTDRVTRLPGQPESPSVSQFSGYVTVNEPNGRVLFYWFFEAQTTPEEKPLLLWLNGGPELHLSWGLSELSDKEQRWSSINMPGTMANLLGLDSPAGVGFSYTNTSSDIERVNDEYVAEDAYSFLVHWLERFSEYKDREFYISGESYAGSCPTHSIKKKKYEIPYAAGHYVPQLAELVYERNKDKKGKAYINLKGFIVGNPVTNDSYDSKGRAEYAWSHAVVSDEVYSRIKKHCDFKISNLSDDCNAAMDFIDSQYQEIDAYNIYAPKCLLNQSSASSTNHGIFVNDQFKRRKHIFSGYDPCYSSHAEDYFNKQEVQKAFHANVGKWHICSGDADGKVPVIGSRYCVEALGLPIKTQWQPWYLDKQVAGRFVEYYGMSMVTVRGAGHMVPPAPLLKHCC